MSINFVPLGKKAALQWLIALNFSLTDAGLLGTLCPVIFFGEDSDDKGGC